MNDHDERGPAEGEETPEERALPIGDVAAQVSHLLDVGQVRRAREMAESLLADDPTSPVAFQVLSRVLAADGQREAALAAVEEAIRRDPDGDGAHAQRAGILVGLGRFADAERSLLTAIALDPGWAPHHLLYAHVLAMNDRPARALHVVERALELDADSADGHRLLSELLLRTKPRDWTLSEAAALRALRLDPEDADAHAVHGSVMLHAGRIAEAEASFREALALEPDNALALHGLSEAVMGKSALYRPFLLYSIAVQRTGVAGQVTFIAGLWLLASALRGYLAGRPGSEGLAELVQAVYLALCVYTWFAQPVTRFILSRHYPWLRS